MKKLIVSVFIVFILIAAGVFVFWQKRQIGTYQNKIESLRRERDFVRFQVFLQGYWGIRANDIIHDEPMNRFYFVSNFSGSGSSIHAYDYAQDTPFQNGEDVNIDLLTVIYNERMEKDYEFRVLGLMQGQVIFYTTAADDSPGPCFSEWIGGYELFSVGVHSTNNIKYPYILSPNKGKLEEEKSRACQANLNASYNPPYSSQKSYNTEANTSIVPMLSLAALRERIEDWNAYTLIPEKEKKDLPFATGCAGDAESARSVLQYPIKKLVLFSSPHQYNIEIYQTPNPFHWTTEQFDRLNKCSEAGLIFAQRALPNHLLWAFPFCSAGYAPMPDESEYVEFQQCQKVEKIFVEYLSTSGQ